MAKEKNSRLTNDDVIDILNEIVDPDSIDVEKLAIKNSLCPRIWDGEDKINPEVRKALLKNAKAFIQYLKMNDLKFTDITLTGSLANYNWTEKSDLDVHILTDYTKISDDTELVGNYFRAKKHIWGENVPVQVEGHDVEVYVQDINEPHASTGVYSLYKDMWLTKPIKTMISIDTTNIREKASNIMNCIDRIERRDDNESIIDSVSKMMDRLKNMRKAGLEDEGEFSVENLVFKILRNNGYLEKLLGIKNKALQRELTLENFFIGNAQKLIVEATIKDFINGAKKGGTLSLGVIVGLLVGDYTKEELINYGVDNDLIDKATDFIETTIDNFGDEKPKILNLINLKNE